MKVVRRQRKDRPPEDVSVGVTCRYDTRMSDPFDFTARLRGGIPRLLDLLFPAQCARCQEFVDMPGSLCAACWPEVSFISPPYCCRCGYPFEFAVGEHMLCGNCSADPPPFARARSVLRYDEQSRHMILAFKHADRTEKAPAFAKWMHGAATELLQGEVLIVPVPLHRRRLLFRRYNQAALLAQKIAEYSGNRHIPDLLQRRRFTLSQGGKSLKGRFRNVEGAFKVTKRWQKTVCDAHILLVDDVYTTGATVRACTQPLLQCGARQVDILTLCRVVRASGLSI
jgi:ComF family protein